MEGKKLAIFGSIILSMALLAAGSAGATQRCVLAELMTNTG